MADEDEIRALTRRAMDLEEVALDQRGTELDMMQQALDTAPELMASVRQIAEGWLRLQHAKIELESFTQLALAEMENQREQMKNARDIKQTIADMSAGVRTLLEMAKDIDPKTCTPEDLQARTSLVKDAMEMNRQLFQMSMKYMGG